MKIIDDRCFGKCMGDIICCIYMIMRIDTGQKYIGLTTNLKERNKQHSRGLSNKDDDIDGAIRQYGWDCFIVQILEIVPNDLYILNERERFWIQYYNTYENPYHYNKTPGGNSCLRQKSDVWNYADKICKLYQSRYMLVKDLAIKFNTSDSIIIRILRSRNIKIHKKRHDVWNHSDEVCQLYQDTNMSTYDIADCFDSNEGTIRAILKSKDVKIHKKRHDVWNYSDEVCKLYQDTNMSIGQLAEYFDCNHTTIRNIFKEKNIQTKQKQVLSTAWNHVDEICTLYQQNNMSLTSLGKKFDCDFRTIKAILQENNIQLRSKKPNSISIYSDKIRTLYKNTDITMIELAKQFNCAESTIHRIIHSRN